jgi:branched-chain amino acid transport system substrate-binding protein
VDAGVSVALAHLTSDVSMAAAPVYAAAGVPQLTISTDPAYTQMKLGTTLRLVASGELQARALGEYAAQLPGASRFAVIGAAAGDGKTLADAAARTIGTHRKEVVIRQSVDERTVEFSGLIAELARTSTDVIITTLQDSQVEALVRQLARAGLSKIRIVGGDNLKTARLALVGPLVREIYATSPIVGVREFRNGPAFVDRFRARFHGDPLYGAHYAYDAVHVVADAMERNGTIDPKRLLNRLQAFDGAAPVTGSMRFKSDGEQRYGIISVYRLQGADWVPVTHSDIW